MRLLVSARNAGAALQSLAVLQTLEGSESFKKEFQYEIVACEPAFALFSKAGFQVQRYESVDLRDKVLKSKPDFILAGLAIPGVSIDETLLQLARELNIPSGVIQDYWGYFGTLTQENFPNVFFVLDEDAENLTKRKFQNAKCHIVGSPKHYRYKLRRTEFQSMMKKTSLKTLAYIGQPTNIDGVTENLESFAAGLKDLRTSLKFIYRRHPDDQAPNSFYEKLFSQTEKDFKLQDSQMPIEPLLLQADVVATAFSTAGLDHNYLQCFLPQASGQLVYIQTSEKLRTFMKSIIGESEIPATLHGLGMVARTGDEVAPLLNDALHNEELRRSYWEAANEHLVSKENPSETILRLIKGIVSKH